MEQIIKNIIVDHKQIKKLRNKHIRDKQKSWLQ